MDYLFENLDPDRFQQMCQALLTKEYPNVQCFPVRQPDGGRDAVVYYHTRKTTREFIVFQVKFVLKPLSMSDPHQWLNDIVAEEAPKVKKLIPKGAEAYYLLTNVPGTAHLDSGSIDKVRKILRDTLEIPSECWWRDDLSRRLDNASDLKWVYPEIMTGRDLLHYIIESGLSEHKGRRTSAIRAFIRKQYDNDEEVRFKQVELQNKLLDLFIDVPVMARDSHINEELLPIYFFEAAAQRDAEIGYIDTGNAIELISNVAIQKHFSSRDARYFMGAASLLLHPSAQRDLPQIVLEGAPGQGKSTIAQYICQVHRMRILEKDLEALPKHHRSAPVRIPFKVDLRDLATWLGKQDPFASEESSTPPENWHKSLEAFLAAQVRHDSGGFEFSVADLHEVAKLSAFLLVLDGLDEVADISKRQEIVAEVVAGVNRLRESAASLQVVVTSRPAAFANSPGFPEKTFPHFELVSLTKQQIDDYANKWIKARKLNNRDRADIKRVLKEKLDQPHLRDLSRNTMQLVILLTLIHARGSSLPDQRTALYDSYIERFFDREAEKSSVVREHRNLLINIHGYLAWFLHSEAEQGQDRGRVSNERLRRLLSEYLAAQEQDTSLSDKLSVGVVARIVFLVSRVEGTFEFEVQPLREYFAARYLYKTASYSPAGGVRPGTKLDRFHAIARNFYWLNVTRFYAGFYDQGELPSLVDQLQELAQEEGYRNISHPRVLAAMLLSDSVFAQHKKAMREVIALILDGLGLRHVSTSRNRHPSLITTLVLPKDCGRDELIERCFSILRNKLTQNYISEVIELLRANSTIDEIKKLWYREVSHVSGLERTRWLKYGFFLGLLSEGSTNDLENLLSDDPDNPERLLLAFRARQHDFCERTEQRCEIIVHYLLNREALRPHQQRARTFIERFGQAVNPYLYALTLQNPVPVPLSEILRQKYINLFEMNDEFVNQRSSNKILDKCIEVIETAEREQQHTAKEWASELTPWDTLVEKSRSIWGEQWVHFLLANVASGIKSVSETCKDFPNLLDHSKSLCRRTRYARLRAGAPDWWHKQFDAANSELELMFISLVFLTWASSNTLVSLSEAMGTIFDQLSVDNWYIVMRSVQQSLSMIHGQANENLLSFDINALPENLSERTVAAIGIRAKREHAVCLYQKYLIDYQGSDPTVLEFCQRAAIDLAKIDPNHWQQALAIIAKSYAKGIMLDAQAFRISASTTNTYRLPIKIAEEITENSEKYPRSLVAFAEEICREVVASKVVPVGKIAQTEGWCFV